MRRTYNLRSNMVLEPSSSTQPTREISADHREQLSDLTWTPIQRRVFVIPVDLIRDPLQSLSLICQCLYKLMSVHDARLREVGELTEHIKMTTTTQI